MMDARDDEPKRLRETLEVVDDTAGEEAVDVLPRRIPSEKKHRIEKRRLPEDTGAEAEAGDDGREKARGSGQIDLAAEVADADENAENLKHGSTFLEKLANNGMTAPVDMRGIGEEFDDAEQLTAELGAKEIVADLCAGGSEKLAQGVCVEDFGSSHAETSRAGLIEKDDGDEEVTVGNSGMAPTLNASERNETGPMTRPMLTPGGIVAGTLESPLASGPCWSETDLKFTWRRNVLRSEVGEKITGFHLSRKIQAPGLMTEMTT